MKVAFFIFQQTAHVVAHGTSCCKQHGNRFSSFCSGRILFLGRSYQGILIFPSFWYEIEDAYFAGKLMYLTHGKVDRCFFLWNQRGYLDTCMLSSRVDIQCEQVPTNDAPFYVCVFMIYQPMKEMFSFYWISDFPILGWELDNEHEEMIYEEM